MTSFFICVYLCSSAAKNAFAFIGVHRRLKVLFHHHRQKQIPRRAKSKGYSVGTSFGVLS
jgi:hypothetical protein